MRGLAIELDAARLRRNPAFRTLLSACIQEARLAEKLSAYTQKRDFQRTSEPGGEAAISPSDRLRFIVQKRHGGDPQPSRQGVVASLR